MVHVHTFFVGKKFLDVKGKLSMTQGKCVSEDKDAFQNIMDVFSEYEIKVSEPWVWMWQCYLATWLIVLPEKVYYMHCEKSIQFVAGQPAVDLCLWYSQQCTWVSIGTHHNYITKRPQCTHVQAGLRNQSVILCACQCVCVYQFVSHQLFQQLQQIRTSWDPSFHSE